MVRPTLPSLSVAPTTATLRGAKMASSGRAKEKTVLGGFILRVMLHPRHSPRVPRDRPLLQTLRLNSDDHAAPTAGRLHVYGPLPGSGARARAGASAVHVRHATAVQPSCVPRLRGAVRRRACAEGDYD